jgi:hypothetical protein
MTSTILDYNINHLHVLYFKPFKDEGQTALVKEPVRTAQ